MKAKWMLMNSNRPEASGSPGTPRALPKTPVDEPIEGPEILPGKPADDPDGKGPDPDDTPAQPTRRVSGGQSALYSFRRL